MKKNITPVIIGLITFFILTTILKLDKVTPEVVTIVLDVKVAKDDQFQIFYLKEGEAGFSEKQSIRKEVEGKSKSQKIKFDFPADIPIEKFRIDIGENKNQKLVIINSFKINSIHNSFEYDISESLTPNRHISFRNGQYITKIIDGIYDPFLITKFGISKAFEPQPVLSSILIYILALITSSAFFVLFYLKNTHIQTYTPYIYISLFVFILIVPSFTEAFDFKDDNEFDEKRELAEKPDLEFTKEFPQNYENYYNDNFGLRSTLVNWSSSIKLNVFGISPKSESVQFGKNGFAFLTNGYSVLPSYSNTNLMSDMELNSVFQKQLDIKTNLNNRGIQYFLAYWPNKHTIYNDYLPLSLKMQIKNNTSLADQVVKKFNDNKIVFVDVKEELLNAKKDLQLYHKFDTHWNANGAFIAYQSFFKQVYPKLQLEPFKKDDFEITHMQRQKGDLTDIMGIGSISDYLDHAPVYKLKNNNLDYETLDEVDGYPKGTIITTNKNSKNKKTVLIFRDSYSTALVQFFSLHFGKVIYIWCPSPGYYDLSMVDKTQPDIVMNLCVERYMPKLLLE